MGKGINLFGVEDNHPLDLIQIRKEWTKMK